MSSAGTGDDPINYYDLEWKKGENGSWKDTSHSYGCQLESCRLKSADFILELRPKMM